MVSTTFHRVGDPPPLVGEKSFVLWISWYGKIIKKKTAPNWKKIPPKLLSIFTQSQLYNLSLLTPRYCRTLKSKRIFCVLKASGLTERCGRALDHTTQNYHFYFFDNSSANSPSETYNLQIPEQAKNFLKAPKGSKLKILQFSVSSAENLSATHETW